MTLPSMNYSPPQQLKHAGGGEGTAAGIVIDLVGTDGANHKVMR